MKLTAYRNPKAPDGLFYDPESGLNILMRDGLGVAVRLPDGTMTPFPFEFSIIDGEPLATYLPHERFTVSNLDPATQSVEIVGWKGKNTPTHVGTFGTEPPDFSVSVNDIEAYETVTGSSPDGLFGEVEPSEWNEYIAPPQPIGTAREFISRMLEPDPIDGRQRFRVGDTVRLIRKELFGWIPVGAAGIVERLEHSESYMASKGRYYLVRFDLTPYKLPIAPALLEVIKRATDPPYPEYHESITTNLSPNDLELVKKGAGWAGLQENPNSPFGDLGRMSRDYFQRSAPIMGEPQRRRIPGDSKPQNPRLLPDGGAAYEDESGTVIVPPESVTGTPRPPVELPPFNPPPLKFFNDYEFLGEPRPDPDDSE